MLDGQKVLEFVSRFQTRAQNIKRFEGNPYVKGDNIAEHLTRLSRIVISIAPQLKAEFPDQPSLIEELLITLHIHDDDEVIDGFDIPTVLKFHNEKDNEEIAKFAESIVPLGKDAQEFLFPLFSSFRKRDTLVAKLAKAIDNLAGNQVVIEQELALINPDQARFAIEYIEKVKGISKTIDLLIESQILQIIEFRKNPPIYVKEMSDNVKKLLKIDVLKHVLDRSKVNLKLEELL